MTLNNICWVIFLQLIVELLTTKHNQVRFLSLVILAFAEFLGGCTLSILAPFYSKVQNNIGWSPCKHDLLAIEIMSNGQNALGHFNWLFIHLWVFYIGFNGWCIKKTLRRQKTMALESHSLELSLPAFSSCK